MNNRNLVFKALFFLMTGFGVVALAASQETAFWLFLPGLVFGGLALFLATQFGEERGKKEWQGRVVQLVTIPQKICRIVSVAEMEGGGVSFTLRDENGLLWACCGLLDGSKFVVVSSDNGKFLVPSRLVSSKSDVAERPILQEVV